jgi:hypothetical protein
MKLSLAVAAAITVAMTSGAAVAETSSEAPKLKNRAKPVNIGISFDGEKLMVNFPDSTPVADLVTPLAMASGLSVVADRDVGPVRIALVFDEPLAKPQAYTAIVDALGTHGLRIVHESQLLRVARCRNDETCVRAPGRVTLQTINSR